MRKKRQRQLTKAELRAMGATSGLIAHRVGPDGRSRLEQLTADTRPRLPTGNWPPSRSGSSTWSRTPMHSLSTTPAWSLKLSMTLPQRSSEERHRVYKMMRLNVVMYADDLVEVSHEPNIATPRFWITPDMEMTEERRLSLETKRKLGYAALGVMEGHLEDRNFFVAGRYSVADIALYDYTHVAD